MKVKVVIIGAGLAGLSAAYFTKRDCILTEASSSEGGTAGTLYYKDFKLDRAIHIFYFKSEWVYKWLTETLNLKFIEQTRQSSVCIYKKNIPFPLQFNLHGVPLLKRIALISSILTSRIFNKISAEKNFQKWSEIHYGKHLASIFFKPYNEKLFGVPTEELTTEWMGDYIPLPSVKSVLKGFFNLKQDSFGRNSNFFYPEEGGVVTAAREIKNSLSCPVLFDEILKTVDMENKTVLYQSGLKIEYEYLISTIPLDRLMQKISFLPEAVQLKTIKLKLNATTLLHIMVNRASIKDGIHWLYIPDPEVKFYRITFVHNICPSNCPEGTSALTLEFGGIVNDKKAAATEAFKVLIKMGVLKEEESESECVWEIIESGYVVYDKNISELRKSLTGFLKEHNILSIGRYGNWEYSNMESAIIQGRIAAESITNV